MDIEYLKLNNGAKLKLNKNKLKDRLKSLQCTIGKELSELEKEEYTPTNSLGIIGAEGNIIDVLIASIASISELVEIKKSLED